MAKKKDPEMSRFQELEELRKKGNVTDLDRSDYYGKFKTHDDIPLAVSDIISRFNYFDDTVNKLLTQYFNPQNKAEDFIRVF